MKKQNLKRSFITLFTLIISLGLIFTGCASNVETSAPELPKKTDTPQPTAVEGDNTTVNSPTQAPLEQAVSYVTVDINPSIQLVVENGVVLEAQAFNDDGSAIILSYDVLGQTPHEAIDTLIDAFAIDGYISEEDEEEASVVITVTGNDEEDLADGLKQRAEERVKELNLECEIISARVSQEDTEAAKGSGLSTGRYILIQQLAIEEGISFEEAKEKYASMKMRNILELVGDAEELFEKGEEFTELLDGLTPEQQEILTRAKNAYQTAVKNAQKAFIQAGKDAQKYFKDAKKQAQETFKATKDNGEWQKAQKTLKQQFATIKNEAKQIAKQEKEQAKEAFMAAVAGLGLSDDETEEILDWDLDDEWDDIDFDDDLDDDDEDDDDRDNDDEDDDDLDDDDLDDDDEDDDENDDDRDDDEDLEDDDEDDDDRDDDDEDDDEDEDEDDNNGKGHKGNNKNKPNQEDDEED